MNEENDVFLTRLNRRLETLRQEAIAAGVMTVDAQGQGTFVGLDED